MLQREAAVTRELGTRMGLLTRSDGSGRFAFGPIEVRLRDELTDSATFQVTVSPLNNVPAAELQTLFKAVLLLHRHPRTLIQLVIQTMSKPSVTASTVNLSLNPPTEESSSDEKLPKRRTPLLLGPDEPFMAAEIAASINASTLALINASIPLRATVVAVSLAVLEMDDALRSRNISPTRVPYSILVDPTPEEERTARSCHVFAFAFSGYNPMDPSGSCNSAAELVYCIGTGNVTVKQRAELFATAEESAQHILSYVRGALQTSN